MPVVYPVDMTFDPITTETVSQLYVAYPVTDALISITTWSLATIKQNGPLRPAEVALDRVP